MSEQDHYSGMGQSSRREVRERKAQAIKNIKTRKPASAKRYVAGGLAIAVLGTGLYFGSQAWLSEPVVQQKQAQSVEPSKKEDNKAVPAADTKSKDDASKKKSDETKEKKNSKEKKDSKTNLDNLPAFVSDAPKEATAYGSITIPAFTDGWQKKLVEGYKVDDDPSTSQPEIAQLNDDLLDNNEANHYASTDQPGEYGNFIVSGHRNGPGAPFNKIDELKKGDKAYVANENGDTYTYSVIKTATQVDPSETGVLDSDPFSKYVNDTKQYMTITTCGDWDSSIRVYAVLELVDYAEAK